MVVFQSLNRDWINFYPGDFVVAPMGSACFSPLTGIGLISTRIRCTSQATEVGPFQSLNRDWINFYTLQFKPGDKVGAVLPNVSVP